MEVAFPFNFFGDQTLLLSIRLVNHQTGAVAMSDRALSMLLPELEECRL